MEVTLAVLRNAAIVATTAEVNSLQTISTEFGVDDGDCVGVE